MSRVPVSLVQVRREKINQRMKFLQDLVPGCNKVTGRAAMLDEIIHYVQSLQQQVEVRWHISLNIFTRSMQSLEILSSRCD